MCQEGILIEKIKYTEFLSHKIKSSVSAPGSTFYLHVNPVEINLYLKITRKFCNTQNVLKFSVSKHLLQSAEHLQEQKGGTRSVMDPNPAHRYKLTNCPVGNYRLRSFVEKSSVADPDSWNLDPDPDLDPAFQVNQNPDKGF